MVTIDDIGGEGSEKNPKLITQSLYDLFDKEKRKKL